MFVAGGGVRGYNKGNPSGVFGCHADDPIPWVTGMSGSMFGASSRYLKRAVDDRSVLGEIIRNHLGATQDQLNRIIPGYAVGGESLLDGGPSVLETGGGAFVQPDTQALILERGLAIWLDSEVATLLERVGRRDTRPLLRGGDPKEIVDRLKAERESAYAKAPIKVMSQPGPHGDTVNRILQELVAWL